VSLPVDFICVRVWVCNARPVEPLESRFRVVGLLLKTFGRRCPLQVHPAHPANLKLRYIRVWAHACMDAVAANFLSETMCKPNNQSCTAHGGGDVVQAYLGSHVALYKALLRSARIGLRHPIDSRISMPG